MIRMRRTTRTTARTRAGATTRGGRRQKRSDQGRGRSYKNELGAADVNVGHTSGREGGEEAANSGVGHRDGEIGAHGGVGQGGGAVGLQGGV